MVKDFKKLEEFIMPESNNTANMFIPTTPMFDVGDLDDQENLKQLVVQLTQFTNNIAIVLNQKDSGVYVQEQFINGQWFFPNPALNMFSTTTPEQRQVFRQVFLFPQLPNAGTIVIPHNIPITNIYTFTRIYGVANDTTAPFNYIPIPSTTPGGNIIFVGVDTVNVYISTNFDATNYDQAYVILEWLPY